MGLQSPTRPLLSPWKKRKEKKMLFPSNPTPVSPRYDVYPTELQFGGFFGEKCSATAGRAVKRRVACQEPSSACLALAGAKVNTMHR
jgi:hypothetical protein